MDYQSFQVSTPYTKSDLERRQRALAQLNGQQNMGSMQMLGQQNNFAQQGYSGGLMQYPQDSVIAQLKIAQLKQSLTPKPKEKKHMFGFAKEYLDKHKDTVMTVVVALLVDHFFLGGALREKIKALTENILDNAQKKLSHTPALEQKDATNKSAA